jgi:spore coat protein U-like protein
MTEPQNPARRVLAALLAVVASGGGPFSPARAETSANFDVAAEIVAGCRVDGLGGAGNAGPIGTLDFGTDSSLSTATHSATTTATQTIRLRCTPGVALVMSIDGGAHPASGQRNLQRGTDTASRIAYTMCSDAACNLPIAIGGSTAVSVTSVNGDDVRLPIHARLTLPGGRIPGTYTDLLTVTLTW